VPNVNRERRIRRKRYDPLLPRLYGTYEAAEYLGLTRRHLSIRRLRGQVVPPVAELRCGPIWSESQLQQQAFTWKAPGGPRRTSAERDWRRTVFCSRCAKEKEEWQVVVFRGRRLTLCDRCFDPIKEWLEGGEAIPPL
jgi:hypothetical protein